MNAEKKFMHKSIEKKDFIHKDAEYEERFWTVVHTDEGGYVETDHTISVWSNGGFTISQNDGDGFISLSREIAQAVAKFLLDKLTS